MGKIGRKLFDSFSEDEDSKRVEPDKVEPEKDELEKVVPEKTKQEEVCLEPTEVEAHNEGQKEVEIESSIKKHNWWRDNIISIAALIVSIIVGSISLYFMIKDHKPVDEVEIIKNEIKNNRNKIKALCYKKNGLDELWGDSLICANKIVVDGQGVPTSNGMHALINYENYDISVDDSKIKVVEGT